MAKYPGPKSAEIINELNKYVLTEPYPFVLDLEKCEGMWFYTIDGQRIFDWAGYYGSKLLGHNHPKLYEEEYVKKLTLAANNKVANPDFMTVECIEYYRALRKHAPKCMDNPNLEVYAVNSGAEAVENMMKYLINLHHMKCLKKGILPTNRRFIYFDQAFHGRTIFALNVTQLSHDPILTKDFHGFIPGNLQVPFPAINSDWSAEKNAAKTQYSLDIIEDALKRYKDEIIGIIIEPIQGAGGHRVADPKFFRTLSELAYKYEVFLSFDEVQTAGGQVGSFFAIDQFDLPYPPQAIAAAKKLACGAVFMMHPMTDLGVLDSTWGGHLADMTRFVQEMKIIEEEHLIEQVPVKTEYLVKKLKEIQNEFPDLIANIRGMGLYQGFTVVKENTLGKLKEIALEEEDMLLIGAGTESIRLRPNISVTVEDIDIFAEKLRRCLKKLQ